MTRPLPWLSVIILAIATHSTLADEPPTYHRDIAPILQQHCQDCHRPGQVAPFSLLTYDHARKRAADLAAVTHAKLMPPWPASTEEGGPFRDVRQLSDCRNRHPDRLGRRRRARGRPRRRPARPRLPRRVAARPARPRPEALRSLSNSKPTAATSSASSSCPPA